MTKNKLKKKSSSHAGKSRKSKNIPVKMANKAQQKKKLALLSFTMPFPKDHFIFTHLFKKREVIPLAKVKKEFQKTVSFFARNRLIIKAGVPTLVLLSLTAAGCYNLFSSLPNPTELKIKQSPQTTIIRDRNGKILYHVFKDANRIKLSFDEIPEVVKKATLAIEDAQFYSHHGVSVKAIARAFLSNLSQHESGLFQGGSTITQQLVKNSLLSPERTYSRKLKEIILALWTEADYSKKEIFEMYLNEVGYGGTAYGIEAAAKMYFGKSAKDLSLAEASFLAGLPAAPTTFSPFGANPELATMRQHEVLNRMLILKMINRDQYDQASSEQLAFTPQRTDILAPHFVMYVRDQLVQRLGEKKVLQGGLDVTTTLDLDIQNKGQEIVSRQIAEIGQRFNIGNSGMVVTSPYNGDILAMVGSVDFFNVDKKGYVNATTSFRQPGSSIKPVNYAYAFDHGFTPGTIINDSPVKFVSGTESYTPKNYDGKFHGNVTLRAALANSYNIPAVNLLNKIGVANMLDQGIKMGIKSWREDLPVGLSLTLGGAEVTMLDMARAYGTLANLGRYKDLNIIRQIRDSSGDDITAMYYETDKNNPGIVGQAHAEDNQQVVSPMAAYWVTDVLSDNVARLPAFGPYAKLTVPGHKVAVKTGTTNSFRDNWTIGYTPEYLVATWVGNNDGSYMNQNLVSGITGAAPIWNEMMTDLLKDHTPKEFPRPKGMVPVKICAVNGLLTCSGCPLEKIEYFLPEKVPTKQCYFRAKAECDAAQSAAEGKSDEERKALLNGCT